MVPETSPHTAPTACFRGGNPEGLNAAEAPPVLASGVDPSRRNRLHSTFYGYVTPLSDWYHGQRSVSARFSG